MAMAKAVYNTGSLGQPIGCYRHENRDNMTTKQHELGLSSESETSPENISVLGLIHRDSPLPQRSSRFFLNTSRN